MCFYYTLFINLKGDFMFFKASTKNSIIMDLYLKEKENFFSKHFHLINKDTNLNYQNKKGDTLLHLVLKYTPDSAFIMELLMNNANPYIKNKEGVSPAKILEEMNNSVWKVFKNYSHFITYS